MVRECPFRRSIPTLLWIREVKASKYAKKRSNVVEGSTRRLSNGSMSRNAWDKSGSMKVNDSGWRQKEGMEQPEKKATNDVN